MSFRPKYQASPPTLLDGQFNSGLLTSAGALVTSDGSLAAVIGDTDDAAWDGVAADATVIALLKAIALNTEPA